MAIVMIQIRQNIFETNSSSVHTLVICTEDEFKKFDNDELCIDDWNDTLVPFSEYDGSTRFLSSDDFFEDKGFDHYLEHYEEHREINGTKIVVFGRYGND